MEKAWSSSWSKAYNIICEARWSSVIMSCMASSATGLLVFSEDVTEDRMMTQNIQEKQPAKDSQQNIKNEHLFMIYLLSNYIWAPENEGTVYKNGCNS